MAREVVLDTETTGLDYKGRDRVIEIGCIELVDLTPTGNRFHTYVNPGRSVPYASTVIHGITDVALIGKPAFSAIAEEFVDFLMDSTLVIHNAAFDCSFLNAEFKRIGKPGIKMDRVIDTINIARQKYPGSKFSLDALCRRFGISLQNRRFHGALRDAELLSKVYISMMFGEQVQCFPENNISSVKICGDRIYEKRYFVLSDAEEAAHREFIRKNIKNPIWGV